MDVQICCTVPVPLERAGVLAAEAHCQIPPLGHVSRLMRRDGDKTYLFLADDYQALEAKIAALVEEFRDIGQEMGLSCQEGAETFHDNFAYEDGERQQRMLSSRLRELIHLRNCARVVSPDGDGKRVGIGRRVTVVDEDTGEERRFKVGSYMVFSNNGTISYHAPLARLLIGARVGEARSGRVGRSRRSYEVVAIE